MYINLAYLALGHKRNVNPVLHNQKSTFWWSYYCDRVALHERMLGGVTTASNFRSVLQTAVWELLLFQVTEDVNAGNKSPSAIIQEPNNSRVAVHKPLIRKINSHLRVQWCKHYKALVYRDVEKAWMPGPYSGGIWWLGYAVGGSPLVPLHQGHTWC